MGRLAEENAHRNPFWKVASAPKSLDSNGKMQSRFTVAFAIPRGNR